MQRCDASGDARGQFADHELLLVVGLERLVRGGPVCGDPSHLAECAGFDGASAIGEQLENFLEDGHCCVCSAGGVAGEISKHISEAVGDRRQRLQLVLVASGVDCLLATRLLRCPEPTSTLMPLRLRELASRGNCAGGKQRGTLANPVRIVARHVAWVANDNRNLGSLRAAGAQLLIEAKR